MSIIEFALILHLAGSQPYSDGQQHATLAACERAGQAWLKRLRFRSPNDHYECARVSPEPQNSGLFICSFDQNMKAVCSDAEVKR